MPGRSFRRLRITRDLEPPAAGFMGLAAAPRLLAGDIVLECPGPAAVGESEVAVVIQLGGPWFAVPADAVEDVEDVEDVDPIGRDEDDESAYGI